MENQEEYLYFTTLNFSKFNIGDKLNYSNRKNIKSFATDNEEKSKSYFFMTCVDKKQLFEEKQIVYKISLSDFVVKEIILPDLEIKTLILIDGALVDLEDHIEKLTSCYSSEYLKVSSIYGKNGSLIVDNKFRYVITNNYEVRKCTFISNNFSDLTKYSKYNKIYITENISNDNKNIFELGCSLKNFLDRINNQKNKIILSKIL